MNDKQYPLSWPPGWRRTDEPDSSRFGNVSISRESDEVVHQLEMMGATNIIISSNMRYRNDGIPYANQGYIEDKGVAVYFNLNGEQQCIPCDKWNSLGDNLRAINKTVEALRGIERWGAKEMVNAAFKGFRALPETIIMGEHTSRLWHDVLQVSPTADYDIVQSAYKRMLHKSHPDTGGSDFAFQEVQTAWKQYKEMN
ncbi:MAG: J domain-containing protein [Flavobacteriales bacterium]|nr:J domain-containing protein [Flavobacteriales bacterium]